MQHQFDKKKQNAAPVEREAMQWKKKILELDPEIKELVQEMKKTTRRKNHAEKQLIAIAEQIKEHENKIKLRFSIDMDFKPFWYFKLFLNLIVFYKMVSSYE